MKKAKKIILSVTVAVVLGTSIIIKSIIEKEQERTWLGLSTVSTEDYIREFNEQFDAFEGQLTGRQVNILLNKILKHNKEYTDGEYGNIDVSFMFENGKTLDAIFTDNFTDYGFNNVAFCEDKNIIKDMKKTIKSTSKYLMLMSFDVCTGLVNEVEIRIVDNVEN